MATFSGSVPDDPVLGGSSVSSRGAAAAGGSREVFDRRFDPGIPESDISPFAPGLPFPSQLFGIYVPGDSEIRRDPGLLARDQTLVSLSSLAPGGLRPDPVKKTKVGVA